MWWGSARSSFCSTGAVTFCGFRFFPECMKNYRTLLGLALAIALPAAAQDTHKTTGYGYFGGASVYESNLGQYFNVGGGAERLVHKGWTVGADAGYLGYYYNFT